MSNTHNRKKAATPLTDGIGLKKLVAGAFLVGGLGAAVIGLGAGLTNADPGGSGSGGSCSGASGPGPTSAPNPPPPMAPGQRLQQHGCPECP